MRLTKTLLAAAVGTAALASSAVAGGFSDEIVEAPVVVVEPEPARGSLPGWVIPAALAAGFIALALSDDS